MAFTSIRFFISKPTMIERNDPCFCGSGKKWKKCHYPQVGSNGNALKERYFKQYKIILKNEKEIEGIRAACRLTAQILDELCKAAKEGVTTNDLDRLSRKLHADAGATPATLGYGHPPYPKTICTSLNDMICHGIPNDVPLKEGDIMNIDASSILHGFYGDSSRMVMIGRVSPEKKLVVDCAYECLQAAIQILKPGLQLGQIGQTIERVAHKRGCSVVHQFVAHGVGLKFHEAPQIPHYANDIQIPLAQGMTFTIEPMINAGVAEGMIDPRNQWEARTVDGRPSAQWEHTVLITNDGYEILTLLEG
jgi:methionyl aminopeptidase